MAWPASARTSARSVSRRCIARSWRLVSNIVERSRPPCLGGVAAPCRHRAGALRPWAGRRGRARRRHSPSRAPRGRAGGSGARGSRADPRRAGRPRPRPRPRRTRPRTRRCRRARPCRPAEPRSLRRCATATSSRSPARWPSVSLTSLMRSRSSMHTAISRCVRRARPIDVRRPSSSSVRLGRLVRLSCSVWWRSASSAWRCWRHVVERQRRRRSPQPSAAEDRLPPGAAVAQLAVRADDRVLEAVDDVAPQQARDRSVARGQRRDACPPRCARSGRATRRRSRPAAAGRDSARRRGSRARSRRSRPSPRCRRGHGRSPLAGRRARGRCRRRHRRPSERNIGK